jgi:hypothetical protein
MGPGNVTCYRCRRPLAEGDFLQGFAIQVGSLAACEDCAEPLLAKLTPEQRRAALRKAERLAASAQALPPEETLGRPVSPRPARAHRTTSILPVQPPARKPAVPPAVWIAGGAVAAALVLGLLLFGGSPEPPPDKPSKPDAASRRVPPRKTAAPDAAKAARAEEEAKRREIIRADIAAVEKAVRNKSADDAFGEALALAEAARKRHDDPRWNQAIDRLAKEVRDATDGAFIRVKGKALDALAMEQDDVLKKHVDEVARWGSARHVEELKKALAAERIRMMHESLAGWWKLDETEGKEAADASGNDFTARLKGNPTWIPARLGGGLRFDGDNDHVELPSNSLLDRIQGGNYTAAAWFKPEATPSVPDEGWSYFAVLIKQGTHIGIHYDQAHHFTMCHWLKGQQVSAGAGDRACPPGSFYHVTGVVDRSKGETRVYVNGVRGGTKKWKALSEALDFRRNRWRIGIAIPRAKQWRWATKGVIDDVRLYTRPLSDEAVAALFREASGNP